MSIPEALAHLDKYGDANLDAGTLRILRNTAIHANAEDKRIRDSIADEETAVTEWDPLFKVDTERRNLAIARIEAELKARGLRP